MILPGSRYASTPAFSPAPGIPGGLLRPRDIGPAPGVIEHTVTTGERMDLLADHYYNDPRQWWLILDANPDVVCASDVVAPQVTGYLIQIPAQR
jgi:hypothetical protein